MLDAINFLGLDKVDVVVYHSPCADGHAAAAVFWDRNRQVTLHGLHPKDKLITVEFCDLVKNKNVIFVDIAFSRDEMIGTAELARKVIVLDHHVTNQTTLENLSLSNMRVVFLMDIAGVRLAWRFTHWDDESTIPKALYYIALKDVWQHENVPEALYFTTAFTCPTTWRDWIPYLIGSETDAVIAQGKVVYDYQRSVLKTMMEKVEYQSWRGYRIAIVNVPFPWISDIGAMMCETEPEKTIAVIWNKPASGPYSVSLRSHNPKGPNIESIALEFKGGGHVHGAGLRLDRPPYEVFKE